MGKLFVVVVDYNLTEEIKHYSTGEEIKGNEEPWPKKEMLRLRKSKIIHWISLLLGLCTIRGIKLDKRIRVTEEDETASF